MPKMFVSVVIYHGNETVMATATDNDIESENVQPAARLLMDTLYTRLDDQVSAAKLRAHRRRLRASHRRRAVGRINAQSEEEGGREIAQ